MLVKPVYMGLLINVLIPVALLIAVYLIEQSGGIDPLSDVGPAENLTPLFWIFAVLAIIDGGVAIFVKQWKFYLPMIASRETFVEDFKHGVFISSIICYVITSAIALYGLVIYFLGGSFSQFLLFVFVSLIAFQIVRPRHGFLKKVLVAQERHVEAGRFFVPKN